MRRCRSSSDQNEPPAAVGKHLFAALLAEGLEALAAELQQRVALAIAQLVAADEAFVAIAIGGDAVEGEPGSPRASQDPPGHILRQGGAMERCWRLPGGRARFGVGRPVRQVPLLGSRLVVPPQSLSQR